MTTFEPGAMLVFTQGALFRPRSTAFLARSPAPTITEGFDVFVQLVMAVMTTVPSPTSYPAPSTATSRGASREKPDGTSAGRSRAKAPGTSARRIRSWGRLGPAMLGSTVDRSSSREDVYSGSGVSSVRKSPSALVTRSTRSTSAALRPVPRRYRRASASTGKKPMVAPYSGDMLASVALSGRVRVESPGPKYSTKRPTTPCLRSISVARSTRSVAVAPSGRVPVSFIPTTSGRSM